MHHSCEITGIFLTITASKPVLLLLHYLQIMGWLKKFRIISVTSFCSFTGPQARSSHRVSDFRSKKCCRLWSKGKQFNSDFRTPPLTQHLLFQQQQLAPPPTRATTLYPHTSNNRGPRCLLFIPESARPKWGAKTVPTQLNVESLAIRFIPSIFRPCILQLPDYLIRNSISDIIS